MDQCNPSYPRGQMMENVIFLKDVLKHLIEHIKEKTDISVYYHEQFCRMKKLDYIDVL